MAGDGVGQWEVCREGWCHEPPSRITTMTDTITLVSWNVRGLNNYTKSARVGSYLHNWGVQIACLQESYMLPGKADRLCRKWRERF